MEAHFLCWNGPCEGQLVTDCPVDAAVGTACAVPWRTIDGSDRYAVYILLRKPDGTMGLVYSKRSYTKPYQAQQRVHSITRQVMAVRAQATSN